MEVDSAAGAPEEERGCGGDVDAETEGTSIAIEGFEGERRMFEELAQVSELRVKNQQKDEEDLTETEKVLRLKELFSKHPLQFLTRFETHLQHHHLKCFQGLRDENIKIFLEQLDKNLKDTKIRFKNRRYAALQKLVETTEYFSEEEMQRRNPILYDQLIGKYQSKEEKEVFLKRSTEAAASSKTPLTDLLMAHMNRNENFESYRRLEQEQQKEEEDKADAEYVDGSDDEMGGDGDGEKNGDDFEEIDDDGKELLKEEFYTTMYNSFLEGKDTDFDYNTVDRNEEYDVGENLNQDAEDKYFEDEEPCEINSDSNSLDDLYHPPVKCSEIESKIKLLNVETNGNMSASPHNEDMEDDDELDRYMKTIEKQLTK